MSRYNIYDLNTSTSKTEPKYPNVSGICRPSQDLRHLQPSITHRHTGKICPPQRLCSAIKCMYKKSVVKLIIGKVKTSINLKVGVKQEDSMAPFLFLFLMMEFSETLEDMWTTLGLSKAQFEFKETHQNQQDN